MEKLNIESQRMVNTPEMSNVDGNEPSIMENVASGKPLIRRFFAFIVDAIVLGIIGQILITGFSSFILSLSSKGRFVGLIFSALYFGLGNSSLFNGKTIGKCLLKIEVRDLTGEYISILRSMLRSLMYIVPFIFNQWALDIGSSIFAQIFWLVIVSWLFTYLIALPLFVIGNWRSGRLIHDVIFSTTVHLKKSSYSSITLRREKCVLYITLVIFFLFVLWFSPNYFYTNTPTSDSPVEVFYGQLENDFDDYGFHVNVRYVQDMLEKNEISLLRIRMYSKTPFSGAERKKEIHSVAAYVLENYPVIDNIDLMSISFDQSIDIGIASRSNSSGVRYSVGQWREILHLEGDLNQGKDKVDNIPMIPSLWQ